MSDTTTINISKKVRAQLDKLGDRHEETYCDIIEKCVKAYRKSKK
jgi:predicted transcriptional regulator